MQLLLNIDDTKVDAFLELLKSLDFVKEVYINPPLTQLEVKLTPKRKTFGLVSNQGYKT